MNSGRILSCALVFLTSFSAAAVYEWTGPVSESLTNTYGTVAKRPVFTSSDWRLVLWGDGTSYPQIRVLYLEKLGDGTQSDNWKTLDVSELWNFPNDAYGNKMYGISMAECNSPAFKGLEKLIVSTNTYTTDFKVGGMTNLVEVRTTDPDRPHEIHTTKLSAWTFWGTRLEGEYVFKGVLEILNANSLSYAFHGTRVGSVSIEGDYVFAAANGMFANCPNLTNVVLASSVQTVSSVTNLPVSFLQETQMKFAYWPQVRTIGHSAYSGCLQLHEAIFPSATNLAATGQQFCNCMALTNIVFGGTSMELPVTTSNYGTLGYMRNLTQTQPCRILWNTTTAPVFNGNPDRFLFVGCWGDTAPIVNYVRKEAHWENLSAQKHCVEEGTGVGANNEAGQLYFRSASGVKSCQQKVKMMDTVVTVDVRTNEVTVFKTMLPGLAGQDASYTLFRDNIFGSRTLFVAASSTTEGVVAQVLDKKTVPRLVITVPASLQPAPDGNETKDLSVVVNLIVRDIDDRPGMAILIR